MSKQEKLVRLVVLGDGGVGKTALTIQLCRNLFVETYDPTIEDSYRKQISIDNISTTLEILDTAGQEEYTALLDQHIREQDGYIVVYSITDKRSFEDVRKFIDRIYQAKSRPNPLGTNISPEAEAEDVEPPLPIMLVGNKSDRVVEREVQTAEGLKIAKMLYQKNRPAGGRDMFFEASAKNGDHVEAAFFEVVREIRRQTRSSGVSSMFSKKDGGTPTDGPAGKMRDSTRKLKSCAVM